MNVLRRIKVIGLTIGLILITVGLLFIFIPKQVQIILNTFTGILFITLGISGVIGSLTMNKERKTIGNIIMVISALLAIFGVLVFLNPSITLFMVGMFVSLLAIGTGIENIITGISIRKSDTRGTNLIIFGLVHFIFGLFMAWNTFETMMLIVMIIGIYMVVYGASLLASLNIKVEKNSNKLIDKGKEFHYDFEVHDFEKTDEDIR